MLLSLAWQLKNGKKNPNLEGNIRDYTDILHLVILSNLEVLKANMVDNHINQSERLEKLNATARKELHILSHDKNIIGIGKLDESNNNNMLNWCKRYINKNIIVLEYIKKEWSDVICTID